MRYINGFQPACVRMPTCVCAHACVHACTRVYLGYGREKHGWVDYACNRILSHNIGIISRYDLYACVFYTYYCMVFNIVFI